MADGVNTGGFVPTQPAIVDTSAAFTRLLNIAQRQQERETAMQLAEQQRLQKQMEAQLDIINGFDSSKMVADDRMMFNDAVNQLRMDFVEGRITDPMQFRGRVAKLRNYYGQFTQYAQNPETLAARDNMMKISYYPSELNKANEQLGAGVEYVAGQDIYNDKVNTFEHPLGGASYQITPQGDILVGTPQGNIPVDSLPRQGAQLFVPELNVTGEGTIDGVVSESSDVARAIQRNVPSGKYIPTAYEGVLMGTQSGRAGIVSSYEQAGNSFGGFEDLVEAFISDGRVGVSNLIQNTPDENRAASLQALANDLYGNGKGSFSYNEWKRSVENRYGIDTPSKTTAEKQQKRSRLLNSGVYLPEFTYYDPRKDTSLDGVEAQPIVVNNGMEFGIQGGLDIPLEGAFGVTEGMTVKPVSITFFKDGELPVLRYADPESGELERLPLVRSEQSLVNRYLEEEFGVTLDELKGRANKLYPQTAEATVSGQQASPAPTTVTFPFQNAAPQPEEVAVPSEEVVPPTVAPEAIDTGVEVTARPGTGEYNIQKRNEENRQEAIEDPESLKLKVREDYNISPLVTRTPEDKVFRDNLRNLLDDAGFQNALVQSGYVDFRGVLGDISGEAREKAMMTALDTMGDDERAIYVKQFIQTNKDRF